LLETSEYKRTEECGIQIREKLTYISDTNTIFKKSCFFSQEIPQEQENVLKKHYSELASSIEGKYLF